MAQSHKIMSLNIQI